MIRIVGIVRELFNELEEVHDESIIHISLTVCQLSRAAISCIRITPTKIFPTQALDP